MDRHPRSTSRLCCVCFPGLIWDCLWTTHLTAWCWGHLHSSGTSSLGLSLSPFHLHSSSPPSCLHHPTQPATLTFQECYQTLGQRLTLQDSLRKQSCLLTLWWWCTCLALSSLTCPSKSPLSVACPTISSSSISCLLSRCIGSQARQTCVGP